MGRASGGRKQLWRISHRNPISSLLPFFPFPLLFSIHVCERNQDVCRSPFFQPLPEARLLGLGQPGALNPLSFPPKPLCCCTLLTLAGLQGHRPRCRRWYWPASVAADEAQPPCHSARPLRYPWWTWYVCGWSFSFEPIPNLMNRCRGRSEPHQHQQHRHRIQPR